VQKGVNQEMGYSKLKEKFLRNYKKARKQHPEENALKIAFIWFDKAEYFRICNNKDRAFNLLLQANELVYFVSTDGMIEEHFGLAQQRSQV
jgi:hypothetical protein